MVKNNIYVFICDDRQCYHLYVVMVNMYIVLYCMYICYDSNA